MVEFTDIYKCNHQIVISNVKQGQPVFGAIKLGVILSFAIGLSFLVVFPVQAKTSDCASNDNSAANEEECIDTGLGRDCHKK